MSADTLIDRVIGVEGGYSDNPNDAGGPTKWGITEQVARAYGYPGDMCLLPRETAVVIYKQRYWTRPGFAQVADRYPRVAEEMFDTGVNMGPTIAIEFLQRALNELNRGGRDYADLNPDGDLGPVTLTDLDGYKRVRGADGERVLLLALNVLQGARYFDITQARPANEAFLYGWLANRVALQ